MAVLYLESSALIKRYVPEKGSEVLDALVEGGAGSHDLTISVLAILEQKSVLARLVRNRDISRLDMREALAEFARDRKGFVLTLPMDNDLIDEASGHIDRHPLRSLDALHLAAALRVSEIARRSGAVFAVVCSDGALMAACQQAGLEVINPENDEASARLGEMA